jgi:hypothetical protein
LAVSSYALNRWFMDMYMYMTDEGARLMEGCTWPITYNRSFTPERIHATAAATGLMPFLYAFLAGTVQGLLSSGDVDSLKAAQGFTKCIALFRAQAQRAAQQSLANRTGCCSAIGTGAAQGVQRSQQSLLSAEAQSEVLETEADQLYSKLRMLRRNVDSNKADLAALLASMEATQQPACSSQLSAYSDLLLQVSRRPLLSHAGIVTSKALASVYDCTHGR